MSRDYLVTKLIPSINDRLMAVSELPTPVWVFDLEKLRVAWANTAGLNLWGAESLDVLQNRDFSDMSVTVKRRLEQCRKDVIEGKSASELWLFTPQGKPYPCQCFITGIALDDGRTAMLCQAQQAVDKDLATLHSLQAVIHTSVMISLYDEYGHFIFANPAARDAFNGHKPELCERFLDDASFCTLMQGLEQDGFVKMTAQIGTADSYRWCEIDARYCLDAGNSERSILVSETDVTEKHQFNEALKLSEQSVRDLIESSMDAILVHDGEEVLLANAAASKLFCVDNRHVLLGLPSIELINPQFRSLVKYKAQEILTSGEVIQHQTELMRLNGEIFTAQAIAFRTYYKSKAAIQVVLLDMTENLKAAATLQRKEEDLRRSLESIGDSVIATDIDGLIISMNPKAEKLTGWSIADVLDRDLLEVCPLQGNRIDVPLMQTISQVVKTGKGEKVSDNACFFSKEGRELLTAISIIPTRDIDNKITGTEVVLRDLTEQVVLRERLAMMQIAIDNSTDAAFIIREDASFLYVNKTACQRLGYSREQLLTMTVHDIFLDFTPQEWTHHWQALIASKSFNFEARHITSRGEHFPVEVSVNYFEENNKEYNLAFARDISDRKQSEEQILHQAQHDMLTDLPNRLLLLDRLGQAMRSAQRQQNLVALLFLDIDNFKKINDGMGHTHGDQLLVKIAKRLSHCIRQEDTVARFGGDEFVILLTGLESPDNAHQVANIILEAFRQPFLIGGKSLLVTTSIGIALYPDDSDEATELLRQADIAMYHSKEQGRNNSHYYAPQMNQAIVKRLQLEEQLGSALVNKELELHYQPIIDLSNGKVVGAEALLRWTNSLLGNIPPLEFIEVAEHADLIIPIGHFVLCEALQQLAKWQQLSSEDFKMSVNVSPKQLNDPLFCKTMSAAMRDTGIASSSLIIEITESVLISQYPQAEKSLVQLVKMGIKLAMDDFGTGYSSLTYLRNYPFSILKIDKGFVNGVATSSSDNELVRASIAIAHSLDLVVVAEGIEVAEQEELLKKMQADRAQGYYYSQPLPASEFSRQFLSQ